MRKYLLSAFVMLSMAGTASAAPIALPSSSPLFFQFLNQEQVDTSLTNSIDVPGPYGLAGNWGVVLLTNIQTGFVTVPNEDIQGTGNPIFANQILPPGAQITGLFYDIDLTSGTTATGGILDLYWQEGANVNMATAQPNLATVNTFTSGTFLARINFASGIRGPVGDCNTTIESDLDVTNLTGTGRADSFGNVDTGAGGAWAASLNGNWFNTPCGQRDIRFSNFFNLDPNWNGTTSNVIGLRSNDPGRVFTAPEPATLALFGLGLLGIARARRKK